MEGHLIPLVRAMEGFVPGRYVARVDARVRVVWAGPPKVTSHGK